MTAHFNTHTPETMAASSSPFRVVPPTEIKSPVAASPAQESETLPLAETTQPASKGAKQRWIWVVGAIAGIAGISLIPIPYQVGGNVQLDWRETARQSVYSPIAGVVQEILVNTGDTVRPGQVVAHLSSRELDREIAEIEEKLTRAHQELVSAKQEQVRAQAALLEANAKVASMHERAQRMQQRVLGMAQGTLPPEVQALKIEQQRLQGQLQEAQVQEQRYEALWQEGAIARSELETRQMQTRNLERDFSAKGEQIRLAQRQLSDSASDEMASMRYQVASTQAAQLVTVGAGQLDVYGEAIATLTKRLQQLNKIKEQLTLRAATGGTVISSDLDLLVGQEIRPESALLRIANLNQLTANVEVREEDLDYVEKGAIVTFRPRQAKLDTYDARVEDVLYNVQPDNTQQRRVATVRVVIDNSDGRLRPGSSGYARISSEWTPLYERVERELLKLVPERFL